MDLTGKLAVVTGGSGDIGRAICEALAAAGADVIVTYVGDLERANTSADLVRAAGRAADVLQLDQRDEASIDAAAAAIVDGGRCDVLVNNAAWNIGIPFRNLETLDSATWDRVQETNLRGPYLLTRALAELLAAGGGRVVNIASVGGLFPGSSSIAYSCSKAALSTSPTAWPSQCPRQSPSTAWRRAWWKAPAWRPACPTRSPKALGGEHCSAR